MIRKLQDSSQLQRYDLSMYTYRPLGIRSQFFSERSVKVSHARDFTCENSHLELLTILRLVPIFHFLNHRKLRVRHVRRRDELEEPS